MVQYPPFMKAIMDPKEPPPTLIHPREMPHSSPVHNLGPSRAFRSMHWRHYWRNWTHVRSYIFVGGALYSAFYFSYIYHPRQMSPNFIIKWYEFMKHQSDDLKRNHMWHGQKHHDHHYFMWKTGPAKGEPNPSALAANPWL